jgi:hypothetical protein
VNVHDGEFVGDTEIGVRGMRGHLFVAERHVFNSEPVAGIDERVIRVPALSKNLGDAFLPEALGHEHRAGHVIGPPMKG